MGTLITSLPRRVTRPAAALAALFTTFFLAVLVRPGLVAFAADTVPAVATNPSAVIDPIKDVGKLLDAANAKNWPVAVPIILSLAVLLLRRRAAEAHWFRTGQGAWALSVTVGVLSGVGQAVAQAGRLSWSVVVVGAGGALVSALAMTSPDASTTTVPNAPAVGTVLAGGVTEPPASPSVFAVVVAPPALSLVTEPVAEAPIAGEVKPVVEPKG